MILFSFYILLLIACLATLLLNRQSLPSYFSYFLYLLLVVIVFEVAGQTLSREHLNANFLDHVYQPLEVTILSLVYARVVVSLTFRRVVAFLVPAFWAFAAFSTFYVEGIASANTASFIGSTLVISFYALVYVYQLYNLPPSSESLLTVPFFWINTGHLFFYFGTFFQMGMDSYIRQADPALAGRLVVINHALNFALYLLYLIGFSCRKVFK